MTNKLKLTILALTLFLLGCTYKSKKYHNNDICYTLSLYRPTYSKDDTNQTLLDGAKFNHVFEAICSD